MLNLIYLRKYPSIHHGYGQSFMMLFLSHASGAFPIPFEFILAGDAMG